MTAPMVVGGAMDGETFTAHAETILAPALNEGDIVILDNLPAHKVSGARQAIEARGASMLFLPPYSPDCNPIERAFSMTKSILRKASARSVDALEAALAKALDAFSPAECRNYFANSGYEPEWTAPAFPEAGYSVSRDFIELVALFIERFLGLGWRDVSDWLQQASIVEPVDPFQGFPFHGICCFPRAQPVDDLRFE